MLHILKFPKNNENIELQEIPGYAKHNGHIFYIKLRNKEIRNKLMLYLKNKGIARTHFVPLHSSPFGKKNTEFIGEDRFTTTGYERLLRLPLHFYLSMEDIDYVGNSVDSFLKHN
jgi:dTDP-4-amino-4,6-dideoxygalactose transaminase